MGSLDTGHTHTHTKAVHLDRLSTLSGTEIAHLKQDDSWASWANMIINTNIV